MSKLSRALARIKRDLEGDVRWYDAIVDNLWLYWDNCAVNTFYYNCKAFVRNLYTFIGLAWTWRPWDSHYTIDVLVKLLKKQAKCLKENDNHVGAQRTARRCYTAAGLLDKAYNRDVDKSLVYLMQKNKWYTKPLKNGMHEMKTNYVTDKKIYDGMYKVARKRSDKAEAEAKKEAWAYLHKYIEHLWD